MPKDNVIPLFGRGKPQVRSTNNRDEQITTALSNQRSFNSLDAAFRIVTSSSSRLDLDETGLGTVKILSESTLGKILDFSSERSRFAILCELWSLKEFFTIDESNKLLDCLKSNVQPDEKLTKKFFDSDVFAQLLWLMKKPGSHFPVERCISANEMRIDVCDKFEIACYQTTLYYERMNGGVKNPEDLFVSSLLDWNIKKRILAGLEHSSSPFIDEKTYPSVQSQLKNNKDVVLSVRSNYFIVTKKP